jgi:predicted secreted protein
VIDLAIAGKGGLVKIDGNRIAEIANWSLDCGADDIDVTSFDSDGWKEFLAGLKEWSGSFEGNFAYNDDTKTGNKGQKVLFQAWLNSETVEISLNVNSSITLEGNALFKPSIEVPVDDKASFSCDIQGTGPLTLPS